MDGKDCRLNNVYVQRIWPTSSRKKYTRRAYETADEARKRIADYLRYFNEETDRFSTLEGALACLIDDFRVNGISARLDEPQLPL